MRRLELRTCRFLDLILTVLAVQICMGKMVTFPSWQVRLMSFRLTFPFPNPKKRADTQPRIIKKY